MANYNHVVLMGNLTRDPELKYTQSGQAVAKLNLAVSRRWRGADDQVKEEVTYIDVDSWGKAAETLVRYTAKGSPLLVSGRLRLDRWENDKGEKRSKIVVTATDFQFLPRSEKSAGGERSPANGPQPGRRSPATGARLGVHRTDGEDLDTPLPDPEFDPPVEHNADEEEIVIDLN